MVIRSVAEFRATRVARGIKVGVLRLTFDLKRALSNLKMKPEEL